MQVIGLCRFSYPAIGGFQVEHDTLEERIAYLYAPERMEDRFRGFETITLPALRAQTDDDFTFLVVVGDSLPDKYRARLNNLLSDIPQAVIATHPPKRHRPIMQRAINAVRIRDGEHCLQFRMDDDDAVGVNFVQRLREVARDVRGLAKRHRYMAIDFNQGYIVRPGPQGLDVQPTKLSYAAAGLGIMLKPDIDLCVMNFAHNRVAQHMPTVTITNEDMILRGHSDFNDSRQQPGVKPVSFKRLDAEGEAHFRKVWNIDADHVRQVFARH
jgi:putative rhamnosyltransferase